MSTLPRNTILIGDALEQLRELPSGSVDMSITSPPFYRQRVYGDYPDQMGLEDTIELWTDRMRAVMREIHRVLTPTGSLWIDVGDTYSRHARHGAPAKSLLLAPERLALALVSDGWILRSRLVWAKTNPMPASVGDRLTTTYDVVLHLVKQRHYFYDLDSIRIPHRSVQGRAERSGEKRRPEWAGPEAGSNSGLKRFRPPGIPGHLLGKNPGDVWTLPTAHYRGSHYATFPPQLVERPILATCPLRVCSACNAPWRPGPGKTFVLGQRRPAGRDRKIRRYPSSWRVLHQPGALEVGCSCDAAPRPGLVLDPFFGTGTVGEVAQRLQRDWLGIELSAEYTQMAWHRLGRGDPPIARAA